MLRSAIINEELIKNQGTNLTVILSLSEAYESRFLSFVVVSKVVNYLALLKLNQKKFAATISGHAFHKQDGLESSGYCEEKETHSSLGPMMEAARRHHNPSSFPRSKKRSGLPKKSRTNILSLVVASIVSQNMGRWRG